MLLQVVNTLPHLTPPHRPAPLPSESNQLPTEDQLPPPSERWGPWEFDTSDLIIWIPERDYGIYLKRVHSSAAILDWIFQILGKNWADASTMHALLLALREVLHPQKNYCPGEEDRRTDGGELAKAYARRLRKHRGDKATP
jgi:hypothetical protein